MKRPRTIISVIAVAVLAAAAAATGAPPAFARASTGTIAGIVHDTRGAAVSGAAIVVYPSELAGPEVSRTSTDNAGRFSVAVVPVGSYKILIDRDSWSEWAPGRITDSAEARAYRVFAGRATMANSIVTAPGVIAGRVVTHTGALAQGVGVTVDDVSIASAWYATTTPDGTYWVSLPPGGDYVVSFTNGELTQHSPRTLDWTLARHYTVRSGRTTRVSERLLTPATLTGRLVDESGTPVTGAQVLVAQIATAGEVWGTTGPDGRYLFDTLPPGDVAVGFFIPDGREQWAYQKASAAEADLITLSLGTVTTVDEALLPRT